MSEQTNIAIACEGGGIIEDITGVIHAHPTLNKAVQYAFEDVSL